MLWTTAILGVNRTTCTPKLVQIITDACSTWKMLTVSIIRCWTIFCIAWREICTRRAFLLEQPKMSGCSNSALPRRRFTSRFCSLDAALMFFSFTNPDSAALKQQLELFFGLRNIVAKIAKCNVRDECCAHVHIHEKIDVRCTSIISCI